jgi:hypothetical protein
MDKHTIRNGQGNIDIAASANEYAKALSLWISENEADQDKIIEAVNTTLDKFNKLPMDMLITQSVQSISDDPIQFKPLEKRVKAYIKSQVDSKILTSSRGRDAGVKRVPAIVEANVQEIKTGTDQ